MQPNNPEISDYARELLLAADADLHHTVMHMRPGLHEHWSLDTSSQTIASGTDSSLHAQWEAALRELIDLGLLVKDGLDVPHFYKVTDNGHEVARALRERPLDSNPGSPDRTPPR